jgi:hypothetical protein
MRDFGFLVLAKKRFPRLKLWPDAFLPGWCGLQVCILEETRFPVQNLVTILISSFLERPNDKNNIKSSQLL